MTTIRYLHLEAGAGIEVVDKVRSSCDLETSKPTNQRPLTPPSRQPQLGMTPVMLAAARGHLHAVRFLLDAGANPNRTLPVTTWVEELAAGGGLAAAVAQPRRSSVASQVSQPSTGRRGSTASVDIAPAMSRWERALACIKSNRRPVRAGHRRHAARRGTRPARGAAAVAVRDRHKREARVVRWQKQEQAAIKEAYNQKKREVPKRSSTSARH